LPLNVALGDGEADTTALLGIMVAGPVSTIKASEEMRQIFADNPFSGIAHCNHDGVITRSTSRQPHFTSRRRVLKSIIYQVRQDLPGALYIGADQQRRRWRFKHKRNLLDAECRTEGGGYLLEQLKSRHGSRVKSLLSSLDSREQREIGQEAL
jgi:hypothetical protein